MKDYQVKQITRSDPMKVYIVIMSIGDWYEIKHVYSTESAARKAVEGKGNWWIEEKTVEG